MICQSWKVLFQAEYSSGQPLRMLVDLRASVEEALGRGKAQPKVAKATAEKSAAVKPAAVAKAAAAVAGASPVAKVTARGGTAPGTGNAAASPSKPKARNIPAPVEAPEFEIMASPEWGAEESTQPQPKKKRL
jgi:hypothetical protein